MKVGDLVKFCGWSPSLEQWDDKRVGVITELSEPTPIFPFQVATVVFETHVLDGISVDVLEVVNENW